MMPSDIASLPDLQTAFALARYAMAPAFIAF